MASDDGEQRLPPTTHPPSEIRTGREFERALCQRSTVDWSQYRLLIYTGYAPYADRSLAIALLKETPDGLFIFVEARGACNLGYGWGGGGYPAALVPHSPKPPSFIKREATAPPCPPVESYPY